MNRKQTTFLGDMLRLMTGTTFAQLLAIIVSPILTRLYSPDAFGVFALFSSVTGVFTVIACLRYELTIVLPKKESDAANLFAISIIIPLFIAILAFLLLLIFGTKVFSWLNAPALNDFYWLIALFILMAGITSANKYWNTRTKQFSRQAIANIGSSSINSATSLGLGFAGFTSATSLISAKALDQAFSATILSVMNWRENKTLFKEHINWQSMKYWLKRYRRFPLYNSWAGLMNNISSQLPSLLLAGFFSPQIVGFYAIGHRVLSMPMNFLGDSIAQVFLQRTSVAKHSGNLADITEKIFSRLLAISIGPLLVLMIAGPNLFSIVLGNEWATAGVYAQILAPWILVVFTSSPLSTIFIVLEEQRSNLLFNIAFIITRAASLVIGGVIGSPILALGLFSLSGFVINAVKLLWVLGKAGVNRKLAMLKIIKYIVLGIITSSPVILLTFIIKPSDLVILLVSILCILAYYFIVIKNDYELFDAIKLLIRNRI